MIQCAAECGISLTEFWEMSPLEFSHYIKGAESRNREMNSMAISAGWYSAAFSRQKKMGKLEKILAKIFKPKISAADHQKEVVRQASVVNRLMLKEVNRG